MISKTKLDEKISISTIYYWINKGFFGLKRSVLNYARKRKKKEKEEVKRVRILGKKIEERLKEINNYPKKLFNYKTPFEVFSIG